MQEMQEMWVWSLSREDPLEKETATHSSILAWKIPWTEEPGGLQSMESQSDATEHTHTQQQFILYVLSAEHLYQFFREKKSVLWSENTSIIKNVLFCNIYKYQIITLYSWN